MARTEGIGIGGVMAEIAWQQLEESRGIEEKVLLCALQLRFDVSVEEAYGAVALAYLCGVTCKKESKVYLLSREGKIV
ncbi:MAG: hypothetical protein V1914_03325 [archaeon]